MKPTGMVLITIILLSRIAHSQWEQVTLLRPGEINDLAAIDPNLYCATDGGIFLSNNNGLNWNRVWSNGSVQCLAASGNRLYATSASNLLITIDEGKSWIISSPGVGSDTIRSLAVSENDIIITTDHYVLFSLDLGSNWINLNFNFGNPSNVLIIDTSIYLSTTQGLEKYSANTNWQTINTNRCCLTHLCATSDSDLFAVVFGTIYHSPDRGVTWNKISKYATNVSTLMAGNGVLYLGTVSGTFFYSDDKGNNWHDLLMNFSNYPATRIFRLNSSVFGATGGKLYRTDNNGASWQYASSGLVNNLLSIQSFAHLGDELFAITNKGILHFHNQEDFWDLRAFPSTPVRALVSGASSLFAGTDSGTFESLDTGVTWNSIDNGKFGKTQALTFEGNTLFSSYRDSLMKFPLDKRIWNTVGYRRQSVTALGSAEGVLFANVPGQDLYGYIGGIFQSDDLGNNWEGPLTEDQMYSCASQGSSVFIGTSNVAGLGNKADTGSGSVFRSFDNGSSWIKSDLKTPIRSLAVTGNSLFAGTHQGIYLSYDGGNHWSRSPGDNPPSPILALTIFGNYLYAGTGNVSIWRHPLNGLSIESKQQTHFLLEQNHPNPFNSRTTFSFSLLHSEYLTLTLFDVLGKQIATLGNGHYEAGEHQVEWDGSSMPAGIYFYKLQGSDFSETKKLIIGY